MLLQFAKVLRMPKVRAYAKAHNPAAWSLRPSLSQGVELMRVFQLLPPQTVDGVLIDDGHGAGRPGNGT